MSYGGSLQIKKNNKQDFLDIYVNHHYEENRLHLYKESLNGGAANSTGNDFLNIKECRPLFWVHKLVLTDWK